jgi:thiol-disulfide isomerase/thioredoxin
MMHNMTPRNLGAGVSGMIAKVGERVSARVSTDVGTDATLAFAALKNDNNNNNKATLLDKGASKTANATALRNFVSNHKQSGDACIIVVFAHWCPHCHAAIDNLGRFLKAHPDADVDSLLVNAEAVDASVFQGSGALVALEFYPTILCMTNGELSTMSNMDDAVAKVSTQPKVTKPNDDEKKVDTNNDETGAPITDVLNMLF